MDNKVITLLNDMIMSCNDNKNKDIYKDLIDKCDKLKQLCEDIKNSCTSVELLKLKYCNKYLYFEGFEGGSQIAYIKNMRYVNDKDFVWDGYLIRLDLFNNDVMGAKLQEVEGYSFEDMPYFENCYDFEPEDFEAGYLEYIDSWLSYNDYGDKVNNNKYSREITKEQVIEIINEHIKNCLLEIK